jgi:signal transduction histidine kinase
MSERRRAAIDEALHELRRPLQALALIGRTRGGAVESSAKLAALALERLERELERGEGGVPLERSPADAPVRCEAALREAVERWRARVALGRGSLRLSWRAGDAVLGGDRAGLEQAVDNLIVNAIEHGGPEIVVEGRRRGSRLLISVRDSGRVSPALPGSPARRRGHGLRVVRRFAAGQGGRFVFERGERGAVATLELPLALVSARSGSAA